MRTVIYATQRPSSALQLLLTFFLGAKVLYNRVSTPPCIA